jgi:hypothetical protein
MARKLPWAESSEPAQKRARTTDRAWTPVNRSRPSHGASTETEQTRIKTPTSSPAKRRPRSRSPSTSPPRGPPAVEPMIEGYEDDDIWMMVEDEFQTLANSFTAHLHHAEYKRLMKRARDAPRKQPPEPTSPMSKETKRKLQRAELEKKQQDVLNRVASRARVDDTAEDAEEEDKVEDPWRNTTLAGLMAVGSQEKKSLKGLEKLPSSTRASKGFSKAESTAQPRRTDTIDKLTRLSKQRNEDQRPNKSPASTTNFGSDSSHHSSSTKAAARNSRRNLPPSSPSLAAQATQPPTTRRPSPSPALLKRKQANEKSKENRLAEVPMFLI